MKPEIRVLIKALRNGKGVAAIEEYCWAKSVVPIDDDDRKITSASRLMCEAMAIDAFDDGAADERIAEQFEAGLAIDHERGVRWRSMTAYEKPTAGRLLRSMSRDDKMKAVEILGVVPVLKAMVSR